MNYTGRPSISGCRPVALLYPPPRINLSISSSHFYHIYKLRHHNPCIFHKLTESVLLKTRLCGQRQLAGRPRRSPPVCFADSPLPEGAFDRAVKSPVEDRTSKYAKAALREGGGTAIAVTEGDWRGLTETAALLQLFHHFSTQKGRRPVTDSGLAVLFAYL